MNRKALPGIRNLAGQPIRVTIGAAGAKEARIIDPAGPLTIPGGHTPESKAAMSEYIRKRKNGEVEFKYNPR
jgi:hypothetical protein